MNGYKYVLKQTIHHHGKFSHIINRETIIHAHNWKEANASIKIHLAPSDEYDFVKAFDEVVYKKELLGRIDYEVKVIYIKENDK